MKTVHVHSNTGLTWPGRAFHKTQPEQPNMNNRSPKDKSLCNKREQCMCECVYIYAYALTKPDSILQLNGNSIQPTAISRRRLEPNDKSHKCI